MLLVKLIEPPCTERYARWCERSKIPQLRNFLLLDYSTKKYYEIPQKHIENTEHMCYTIDSVLKNRRTNAMDNYMEDWIGIEAAASYLDVTKDTIRNWIKKTDIPAHKIGKLWKFKRVELDAWVKSGRSAID